MEKEENQRRQVYLWDGNAAGFYGEREENPQYYLQDELGSPLRIEGEDGSLRESYGYDVFGRDLYGNQGRRQPFGYTGYQHDGVAGTYFAQAREYEKEIGRFASQDLVAGFTDMPFSMNRYTYCFNNGMGLMDLDGAWPSWNDIGHGIIKSAKRAGKWIQENKSNLVKIGIGTACVVAGAVAVGMTGGAALPVITAGLKVAALSGGISAGISSTVKTINLAMRGELNSNAPKKIFQAAFNGFSDGFMAGGMMFGGSQVASVGFKKAVEFGAKTGRKGGIYLNSKIKILSPNSKSFREIGGTIIKFGENIRLDVGGETLLHLHIFSTKVLKKMPDIWRRIVDHIPIGKILSSLIPGINNGVKDIDTCNRD